jgi:hypothetical protein
LQCDVLGLDRHRSPPLIRKQCIFANKTYMIHIRLVCKYTLLLYERWRAMAIQTKDVTLQQRNPNTLYDMIPYMRRPLKHTLLPMMSQLSVYMYAILRFTFDLNST